MQFMQLGFQTDKLNHAKAALLLYAIYRSRGKESSLNGLETWDRCASYIRAALLKSSTLPEFINHFCHKAGVGSIKPIYLKTDGLVDVGDGNLAQVDGIYNYQLEMFNDFIGPKILEIFTNEAQYVILLVRDRIQREKELFSNE